MAEAIKSGHTIIPAILNEDYPLVGKYFQQQQVYALDFDNKDPFNDSKMADETYLMTYDRIMDICSHYGICPIIVYETFSSKPEWKRFRAVFVVEYPITDKEYGERFLRSLMSLFAVDGILCTDIQCIDPSRIFYAGHTIISVHQNVPVDPAAVITAASPINILDVDKKQNSKIKSAQKAVAVNEMVEAIMKHDVKGYTELLSKAVSEAANADADWIKDQSNKTQTINYKYLLKDYSLGIIQENGNACISKICGDEFKLASLLPLHILLGVQYGKEFSCILPQHDDKVPSASINQLNDGRYVYNCWGCIAENQYLDVIGTFSKLMGVEIGKVVKFIFAAIGLEVETEWHKEQKDMIDYNLRFIMSAYFKENYSVIYKELERSKALGQLIFILQYARDHLAQQSLMNDERPTFFLSIRRAAELMKAQGYSGTSNESISRKIIFLSMLGFFDKVVKEDIPDKILQRALNVANKNSANCNVKYAYRQDFFFIPSYTADMFLRAENLLL